jgi:hypothetical protein
MAQRQVEFMDDSNIKCLYAIDNFWGILVFTNATSVVVATWNLIL